MNKYLSENSKQSGATLIVSLVILTVITILGIASIRSSNMELKMVASQRDRAVAFQTAESALKGIERDRISQVKLDDQVIPNRCGEGEQCFTTDCEYGLCFAGSYDGDEETCSLASDANKVEQFWQKANVWEEKARTRNVPKADGSGNTAVKYLVEFMCFVPREDVQVVSDDDTQVEMLPLYRVTVRAEGEAGRASVMLQSVFRGSALQSRGAQL